MRRTWEEHCVVHSESHHRRPTIAGLSSFQKWTSSYIGTASLPEPVYLAHLLTHSLIPTPFLSLSLSSPLSIYIYYVVHVCVCMTGLLTSVYRTVTPLPHRPPRDRCQSVFSVSTPYVCTSGGFINGFTARSLISSDHCVSARVLFVVSCVSQ